jgi:hypothetical protein
MELHLGTANSQEMLRHQQFGVLAKIVFPPEIDSDLQPAWLPHQSKSRLPNPKLEAVD